MAKITVICRNEECTMLNQPQEVEKSEMICPECGEPVIPFGGGKKPNWFKENGKLMGLITVALIVLGGGGFGIFKACQGGGQVEPPVPHSTKIAAVTTDANWTVETIVESLNPNDTIWIKANENITQEEQDKGVKPQITLADSTSTFVLSAETVTDNANVQVKTVDGKSDTYFIAIHKKDFVQLGGNKGGDDPQPTTTNTVFGGRAKYDKAAGVITFTGTVTISLHDEDDNTLTFRRGDKIRSAKVSGGRLVGGEAVIGGESQLLSGINERL